MADFGTEWSATLRRGSAPELDDWLGSALRWCDEADAISMRHFRQELEISQKADRSLVTQADTAIEALLRERIEARYADHGILGEELPESGAGASVRWYVDPIDGTHNFVRGIPVFATLLAVERDGELQAGVISAPALGARWYARRGGGAWAVDTARSGEGAGAGRPAIWGAPRRIHVSTVDDLAAAQLLYSSPGSLRASGHAAGMDRLSAALWRERGFGDFWIYALIAQGSAEVSVEVGPSAYDLAAPALIVEEAGGRFTDITGSRRIDGGSAVASNGLVHRTVLEHLANG